MHPIQIGGIENHVHMLFGLSRTMTIADVVKETKTGSSKWLKGKWPICRTFGWQRGYAALSADCENFDGVVNYIENQEVHHRNISFEEEYREMLERSGVDYDERYMWD